MEQIEFENDHLGPEFVGDLATKNRAKTSLRLRYEAEVAVLKRDLGSLENVRIKLGLSRRKICQVLMVDPSAWTRWTREDSDAPPHIYQALRWYLDSKTNENRKFESVSARLAAENEDFKAKLEAFRSTLRVRTRWALAGGGILVVLLLFLLSRLS
jgi:hypothetical protein